jgi:hypothetical protein
VPTTTSPLNRKPSRSVRPNPLNGDVTAQPRGECNSIGGGSSYQIHRITSESQASPGRSIYDRDLSDLDMSIPSETNHVEMKDHLLRIYNKDFMSIIGGKYSRNGDHVMGGCNSPREGASLGSNGRHRSDRNPLQYNIDYKGNSRPNTDRVGDAPARTSVITYRSPQKENIYRNPDFDRTMGSFQKVKTIEGYPGSHQRSPTRLIPFAGNETHANTPRDKGACQLGPKIFTPIPP